MQPGTRMRCDVSDQRGLLFARTATTSLQLLFNYQFIAGLSLGLLGMYLVLFLVNRYLRRMSLSHSCQIAFV
jgi:hypothetical protein